MAKASLVAVRQAQALEALEARIATLEAKLDAVLAALEPKQAPPAAAEPKKAAK